MKFPNSSKGISWSHPVGAIGSEAHSAPQKAHDISKSQIADRLALQIKVALRPKNGRNPYQTKTNRDPSNTFSRSTIQWMPLGCRWRRKPVHFYGSKHAIPVMSNKVVQIQDNPQDDRTQHVTKCKVRIVSWLCLTLVCVLFHLFCVWLGQGTIIQINSHFFLRICGFLCFWHDMFCIW